MNKIDYKESPWALEWGKYEDNSKLIIRRNQEDFAPVTTYNKGGDDAVFNFDVNETIGGVPISDIFPDGKFNWNSPLYFDGQIPSPDLIAAFDNFLPNGNDFSLAETAPGGGFTGTVMTFTFVSTDTTEPDYSFRKSEYSEFISNDQAQPGFFEDYVKFLNAFNEWNTRLAAGDISKITFHNSDGSVLGQIIFDSLVPDGLAIKETTNKEFVDSGPVEIIGSNLDDSFFGSNENDLLKGLVGKDEIRGRDGEDTIEGGPGNDLILGGKGNDEIDVGDDDDRAFGGEGEDTFNVAAGSNTLFGYGTDENALSGYTPGGPGDDPSRYNDPDNDFFEAAFGTTEDTPGSTSSFYGGEAQDRHTDRDEVKFKGAPTDYVIDDPGPDGADGDATVVLPVDENDSTLFLYDVEIAKFDELPQSAVLNQADPLIDAAELADFSYDSDTERAEDRKWWPLHSIELGLDPFGNKDDVEYSFSNGIYTANGSFNQAHAHVYFGQYSNEDTLVIDFRGTDEKPGDFVDYPNFQTHYDRFKPLVEAIDQYLEDNPDVKVMVTGHSLGAAMVQMFMNDHGGDRYKGYAIASPGAAVNQDDDRILTLGHSQDLVFHAPQILPAANAILDGLVEYALRGNPVASLFYDGVKILLQDVNVSADYAHSGDKYRIALEGFGWSKGFSDEHSSKNYIDTVTDLINQMDRVQAILEAAGKDESDYKNLVLGSAADDDLVHDNQLITTLLGFAGEIYIAGGGNDTIEPGLGNDIVDGGAGSEDKAIIDYDYALSLNDLPTSLKRPGLSVKVSPSTLGPKVELHNILGFNLLESLQKDLFFDVEIFQFSDVMLTLQELEAAAAGNITLHEDGGSGSFALVNHQGTADADFVLATNAVSYDGLGGSDIIGGSDEGDVLRGGMGNDSITGNGGDDLVYGDAGDDILIGGDGSGNDTYDGGADTDTLIYSSAVNPITVDLEAGTATGDDIDNDAIENVENVIGGSGDDDISGDDKDNELSGGPGDDLINGRSGADILVGNEGSDTLTGGDDADTFAFTLFHGADIITDFEIGIDRLLYLGNTVDLQDVDIEQQGNDLIVRFDPQDIDSQVRLLGIAFNDFGQTAGAIELQPLDLGLSNDEYTTTIGTPLNVDAVSGEVIQEPAIAAVQTYFRSILRRDPSLEEETQWVEDIEASGDRRAALEQLAEGLIEQAESVLSVIRLYQAVFGRMPDPGGLDFWHSVFVNLLEQNPDFPYETNVINLLRDWLETPEYVERFGANLSDGQFLELLYSFLSRPPDPAGFDYWLGVLAGLFDPDTGIYSVENGQPGLAPSASRQQVIVAFNESQEYKNLVNGEAAAFLHTAARIASETGTDDINYIVPGDNVYGGTLYNDAPTDIIHSTDIDEGSPDGTLVNDGQLTGVDVDGEEVFSWQIIREDGQAYDPANATFALNNTEAMQPNIVVRDGSKLDFETGASHEIVVRLSDRGGNIYDEAITITVNDVPISDISISSGGTVAENATSGAVAATFQAMENSTVSAAQFSLIDDADGLFVLDGNSIRVAENAVIDFETATSHRVRIGATDGTGPIYEEEFNIRVADVPISDIAIQSGGQVTEGAAAGTVVASFQAFENPVEPTAVFSLLDDANGRFVLDGNVLKVSQGAIIDFEDTPTLTVEIAANDPGGLPFSEQFEIVVIDAAENSDPTDIIGSTPFDVEENAVAGTVVTTLSAVDPDASDEHIFSIDYTQSGPGASFFSIDGNNLVVSGTAALDFETATQHQLMLSANDQNGGSYQELVTVDVTNMGISDIQLVSGGLILGQPSDNQTVAVFSAIENPVEPNADLNLLNDAGGRFYLEGNELRLSPGQVNEIGPFRNYQITLEATDGTDAPHQEDFLISTGLTADLPVFFDGFLQSPGNSGHVSSASSQNWVPGEADFWGIYLSAGESVTIEARRQEEDFDPKLLFRQGIVTDANTLSGQPPDADDEIQPPIGFPGGPFGDPRYEFTAAQSGFYTVVIDSFSSGPDDGGDGLFAYDIFI